VNDFIAHLHRGGPFAYLWRLSDKQSRYFSTEQKLPQTVSADIYMGVHPVTCRRSPGERGRIEDVAAINCLFAEFDAKDYGSKDEVRAHLDHRRQRRRLALLLAARPVPSFAGQRGADGRRDTAGGVCARHRG
jgi:hypothetical protein